MTTTASVDPIVIEQAQQQIRQLVDEIAALAGQDLDLEAFFTEYLRRVVTALAATGGVIWQADADGTLEDVAQIEYQPPDALEAQAAHVRLVQSVLADGEGRIIDSGRRREVNEDNLSAVLLVLAPVKVGGEVRHVVEVRQRYNPSLRVQRGYLAFLEKTVVWVAEFLKSQHVRQLEARQTQWRSWEQFHHTLHATLDSRQVTYAIANEGRNLVGCERLSVAVRRGSSYRLAATSGQDTLDPRAATVRLLNTLTEAVMTGGQALWYTGDTHELAPQVETALAEYVDQSHAKLIGIVPIRRPSLTEEQTKPIRPIGALVVEQIAGHRSTSSLREQTEVLAAHSAAALSNALDYEGLFLLPLWRALGKSRKLVEARTLPKTMAALAAVVAVVVALVFVPYEFTLESTGTLIPVSRREVFATVDGTVEKVFVKHGDHVEVGQPLAQLRNTDLDVAITDKRGERTATAEQLLSVERALFDEAKRITVEERNRLGGQRNELKQKLTSADRQLKLLQEKRTRLTIISPMAGDVTTWNVDQLLLERPVRTGQVLVSLADTSGEWELELRMPEDRSGHLAAAQDKSGRPLVVTYRLATEPDRDHLGTVQDVHLSAEVRGEEGNTVLVRVAIDKRDLAHLRPGSDCRAKIHCGTRSLGYVWLHDVVDFFHSRILFKL